MRNSEINSGDSGVKNIHIHNHMHLSEKEMRRLLT